MDLSHSHPTFMNFCPNIPKSTLAPSSPVSISPTPNVVVTRIWREEGEVVAQWSLAGGRENGGLPDEDGEGSVRGDVEGDDNGGGNKDESFRFQTISGWDQTKIESCSFSPWCLAGQARLVALQKDKDIVLEYENYKIKLKLWKSSMRDDEDRAQNMPEDE
ncbi:hypothetical protein ACLOJK_013957 [Asimina triloba]